MKIKRGFELRTIAGEQVVMATGMETIDFSKMISMNATAAYLWMECTKIDSFDTQTLTTLLTSKYEVSTEQAAADAAQIAAAWLAAGITEP